MAAKDSDLLVDCGLPNNAYVNVSDICKRGRMFLEWRICNPVISSRFLELQQSFLKHGSGVGVIAPQSCAADNMHVSLNEWTVGSEEDVIKSIAVVDRWALELGTILESDGTAELRGVHDFDKRVVYMGVSANGKLTRVFSSLEKVLVANGLAKPTKNTFKPHITICKATKKTTNGDGATVPFWNEYEKQKTASEMFGVAPLVEFVLCAKRNVAEATPPIIKVYQR